MMLDFPTIFILSQKEMRDAQRNRWYWLYGLMFTVLSLALSWFGLSGLGNTGFAGFGRTSASLINLILLIVPLMGLTLGSLSIVGERERGTLLYLLSQPISTTDLLLGKFLGLSFAIASILGLGFGISGFVMFLQGVSGQATPYFLLVLFAFLLALVSLSLGFLISVTTKQGVIAIGIALFVWLGLVVFGDLGILGTSLVLKLNVVQLFSLLLLNPLQIFKVASVLNINGSLDILGPAGLYAFRTYGNQLLPFLLGMLFIWICVPLGISQVVFRKRGPF